MHEMVYNKGERGGGTATRQLTNSTFKHNFTSKLGQLAYVAKCWKARKKNGENIHKTCMVA
jgi:hypothetical protein